MKFNLLRFLFITYVLVFVVITFVITLNDLKSLSISFADAVLAPLTNILHSASQIIDQGSDSVLIEYSVEEHATNIYKHYLLIMKNSFGFISLSTTAITVLVALVCYIFKGDDDQEMNLFKSIFIYLKNLFT